MNMGRIAISKLQEPNEGQFSVVVSKHGKDKMKKDGWAKGQDIEIVRQGKNAMLIRKI